MLLEVKRSTWSYQTIGFWKKIKQTNLTFHARNLWAVAVPCSRCWWEQDGVEIKALSRQINDALNRPILYGFTHASTRIRPVSCKQADETAGEKVFQLLTKGGNPFLNARTECLDLPITIDWTTPFKKSRRNRCKSESENAKGAKRSTSIDMLQS